MSEPRITERPFDDMRALVMSVPPEDVAARTQLRDRLEAYQGPHAPVGRLADAVEWLAGWQGSRPDISRPLIAVFAGTHGVARQVMVADHSGPDVLDIAQTRIKGLSEGGAGVRGAALAIEAAFKIYEMGLEYPCADMTIEASLSERECAAAMAFGMEVVAEGADVLALGNAGIGAAAAAAAIAQCLYGGSADYWANGPDARAAHRIAAVEKAVTRHREAAADPLEVLRCFGGRDIAGLVGAIVAARHQRIPVVLDGFVVCAAAAVLHSLDPKAIAHCYAGHVGSEPAHRALLDRLGLKPLLDLGLGIGDGTGAAFAVGTLKQACKAVATLTMADS